MFGLVFDKANWRMRSAVDLSARCKSGEAKVEESKSDGGLRGGKQEVQVHPISRDRVFDHTSQSVCARSEKKKTL